MDLFHAIILGVVQGLTEFLPVSSSGHLVVFQHIFGFKEPEILFDCAVHIGTLLAVIIYFLDEIKGMLSAMFALKRHNPDSLLIRDIVVGSISTGIIGISFKDYFERAFSSCLTVGIMLCITGIFIGATRFIPEGKKKEVGIFKSFLIGISQGIAIIPGISRSGATITCGLACGLERELAFRFSFLLSIPAIIGAFLLEMPKIDGVHNLLPLVSGAVSSAIVGLISLRILNSVVKKGNLYYFSFYCILFGILSIFYCVG